MRKVLSGIKKLECCIITAIAKIKWKGLSVDGMFKKRRDTQVIISENGNIRIGRNVSFQRNISLTAMGGGT